MSNVTLPSGLRISQPAPAPSPPAPSGPPAGSAPNCTPSSVTNFLVYPNQMAAGGSTSLLLNCAVKSPSGLQGRLTPAPPTS